MPVKVLVTVLTYPCPSLKYVETVCTAGVTEDGRWVWMYPLRLRMLDNDIHKWHWYEFDLEQRPADKDVRMESYYCLHVPHQSSGFIGTEDKWRERRRSCVDVFTSFARWGSAIEYKKGLRILSLGTFKPVAITNLKAEHVDISKLEEKKKEILENMHTQMVLFDAEDRNLYWKMAESIPYRFSYEACDADGVKKWVLVEDRELFSLFLKCRNISGNERVAIKKVREKYLDAFSHKDIGCTTERPDAAPILFHHRSVLSVT